MNARNPVHIALLAATLLAGAAPIASAQVAPVRSSLDTRSRIGLSVVDLIDEQTRSDDQGAMTNTLGPHSTPVSISSADGLYTANSTGSALFLDAASGTFASTQTYDGDRAPGDVTAQSFSTTLSSIFEYDFTLAGEGSIRFQGTLSNSGPSFVGFTARVNVFSEFMPGTGFNGSFFEQLFTDQTSAGPTPFDITVPLAAASGSYRVQIRLTHSGNSGLETPVELGSTSIDWTIIVPTACLGDIADDFGTLGGDGMVSFGDFLAMLGLIGPCPGMTPGCAGDIADDFGTLNGGDGMVSFGDFLAMLGLIGPCP